MLGLQLLEESASAAVAAPFLLERSGVAVSRRGFSALARAAVLDVQPLAVALHWPLLAGSDESNLAGGNIASCICCKTEVFNGDRSTHVLIALLAFVDLVLERA